MGAEALFAASSLPLSMAMICLVSRLILLQKTIEHSLIRSQAAICPLSAFCMRSPFPPVSCFEDLKSPSYGLRLHAHGASGTAYLADLFIVILKRERIV